ncbi:hypothetical protein [Plesiomonas shigelloides]|nr:hypothetical protein [Plesiomonas shigelloides]KAB7697393.1 hypothetical protein GBN15_07730 [Plesiomonas shigelloides]
MKAHSYCSFDFIFVSVALFIVTLYSSSSFSFMGCSLIGVMLLILWAGLRIIKVGVKIDAVVIPLVVFSFFLMFLLLCRYSVEPGAYYSFDSDLKSHFFTFSYIYIAIFLYAYFKVDYNAFYKVIFFIILCHVIFFVIQELLYYFVDYTLDFSTWLGGEGNRTGKSGADIFRGTGFFDEPSIYCGFLISLLSLSQLVKKTPAWLDSVVGGTVIISFSFAGYIMLLLFVLNKYIKINFRGLLVICSVFLIFLYLYLDNEFIAGRLSKLFSGDDSSTIYKSLYISYWLSQPEYFYVGTGISNDIHRPDFFDASYDLTFFGSIITTYGLVLSLIVLLVFVFYFRRCRLRSINYFLIPLIKITVLHTPLFVFMFLSLCILNTQRRRCGTH